MTNLELINLLKSDIENFQKNLKNFTLKNEIHILDLDCLISDIQSFYKTVLNNKEELQILSKSNIFNSTPEPIIKEVEPVINVTPTIEEPKIIEPVYEYKAPEIVENTKTIEIIEEPVVLNEPETKIPVINNSNTISTTPNYSYQGNNNKLKSIKDGIGINDKFAMLKELFSSDTEAYNLTLEKFDSLSSMKEAEDEFVKTINLYGWAFDNTQVIFLFDLLKQKYE